MLEVLPKQLGFYQDPYSDFGRLMADAFPSARLVVDTGIHRFKWTREKPSSSSRQTSPSQPRTLWRMWTATWSGLDRRWRTR